MSNPSYLSMKREEVSLAQDRQEHGLSIEGLVREHYSYIQRLALSILDDAQEAEDAAQETFIAANRSLPGFRGEASPRTWLTAITVNACRGRLRKRKARQGLHNALQALHLAQRQTDTIEEAAIRKEAQRDLRQAVVEVVQHNQESGAYVVASGFGEKADWYQNVMAHPEIVIQVGRKRMPARAERLSLLQATEVMLDYNRRHPAALRALSGILGYRTDGSEADVRFFAEVIPIMALTPQNKEQPDAN